MTREKQASEALSVLHIGKYFPPHRGGMETYLNDLMNVQHRQGLNVSGLVHSSEKKITDTRESIDDLGGSTYTITRSARWFNIGYVPISPFFLLTLHQTLKAHRPDVIHTHLPNASALWLLFSPGARRIPWVIQWHADIVTPSSSSVLKLFYAAFRFFEKRLLRRAKAILATSEAYLLESRPLQAFMDKCHVVPLGLDTKRLPQPSAVVPYKINNGQRHQLLFIGRLSAYKGVSFLIDAMQQLEDTHLWIAGDGEERERITGQINNLGLENRVTLLGDIENKTKWRLIRAADALVLPSVNKNEAFGIVLLEAGYFGLPLVTTQIKGSGVGWVASQFNHQVFCRPEASEELVNSITKVFATPNRRVRAALDLGTFDLESLSRYIHTNYRATRRGL